MTELKADMEEERERYEQRMQAVRMREEALATEVSPLMWYLGSLTE